MTTLFEKINHGIKEAMLSRDQLRLDTLRMLKSKILAVDARGTLPDAEVLKLFKTYYGNLQEALEQTQSANRPETVKKLKIELTIVQEFLPKTPSPEETKRIVVQAIADSGKRGQENGVRPDTMTLWFKRNVSSRMGFYASRGVNSGLESCEKEGAFKQNQRFGLIMHKVKKVKYISGYRLSVTFDDKKTKIVNLESYLDRGVFLPLRELDYFHSVRVAVSTIVWPNHADFCPDVLYQIGKNVKR